MTMLLSKQSCVCPFYRVEVPTDVEELLKRQLKRISKKIDKYKDPNAMNQSCVCPFCRAEQPKNGTELLERLYKQIDKYNDPTAMNMVGSYYVKGKCGL